MKIIRTSTISRLISIAGLLLVWSLAAAAQDIRYNSKPGTDFSKYKTYTWARVPKADYNAGDRYATGFERIDQDRGRQR
jgi:hypothetical protein